MTEPKRIIDYPLLETIAANDVMLVVADPDGVSNTFKTYAKNFLQSNLASNLSISQTITANSLNLTYHDTPLSSSPNTAPEVGFMIWTDGSYIYVANSSIVKKCALTDIA